MQVSAKTIKSQDSFDSQDVYYNYNIIILTTVLEIAEFANLNKADKHQPPLDWSEDKILTEPKWLKGSTE